jgi:hypothetical protein
MTDTPISATSTLRPNHDLQGNLIVAQAEDDFSRIQQSLHTPKPADKDAHRDSSSIDLEKGQDANRQETFDLREYLTSSNDANSAAGIKHKHVGVTWEDLEVLGIGGEENKVCPFNQFPTAFPSHPFFFSLDICVYIRRWVILTPFHRVFLTFLQTRSPKWSHSLLSFFAVFSNRSFPRGYCRCHPSEI